MPLLAAVAVSPAHAEVDYDLGGTLRLRAFWLRNGTDVEQLSASLRRQLQATGTEAIDAQQSFIDMRLRAYLRVTPIEAIRLFGQVEVGDLTFGDIAAGGSAGKNGGRLGTDGILTESKHLYLEFDAPDLPLTVRGGLFATETPGGLVLSEDVAGLRAKLYLEGLRTTLTVTYIKAIENSRRDLDGDGRIDNDFQDEDVLVAQVETSPWSGVELGAHFVADLDNSGPSPTDDTVRFGEDQYWAGLSLEGRLSRLVVSADAVHNFGSRRESDASGVEERTETRAWAGELRAKLDLDHLALTGFLAAATGRGTDGDGRDDGFHTIAPAYARSNVLYDDYGGFDVMGSDLSGTLNAGLEAERGLTDELSLSARVLFARLTETPSVSDNLFGDGAEQDLGWELDLDADYQLYEPPRLFLRSGVLFPLGGMKALFDSAGSGPVWEVVAGTQLNL